MLVEKKQHKAFAYRIYRHFTQQCSVEQYAIEAEGT